MNTAERIFKLLNLAGIEQKAFAALIGTTSQRVSEWKVGKSKSYKNYLPKIAEVLGTSVDYLLTGETKSDPTTVSDDGAADLLEAQLMNLVRQLSPDGKKMLIAQLELMRQQK